MGKIYERIDGRLRSFIEEQHVFFVATAPSGSSGHVNLSPKGVAGTFAVLDEHTVAYLDITASGAETIAHLRQNGRITLMFCAFTGPPKVLRLHGRGRVVSMYDEEFGALAEWFTERRCARAVIVVDVTRVSDSCGYGVPLMDFVGERDLLSPYMERKGEDGRLEYRRNKNRLSIDGLPAFDDDPTRTPTPNPSPSPSDRPDARDTAGYPLLELLLVPRALGPATRGKRRNEPWPRTTSKPRYWNG